MKPSISSNLAKLSLLAVLLANTACGQEPAPVVAETAKPSQVVEDKPAASEAPISPNALETPPGAATSAAPAATAAEAESAASAAPAAADTSAPLVSRTSAAAHLTGQLLHQSLALQPGENAVVSGYSFGQALELARQAAGGSTREQIERALWGEVDQTRVAEVLPAATGEALFKSANAVFVAQDLPVKPSFQPADAKLEKVDFKAAGTLKHLNDWFAQATEGKIPKMFDSLPSTSRFVLANALYFKGSWQIAFDPAASKPGPFAGEQQATYMHAERSMDYVELPDGQGLSLPFKGHMRLWLVLPKGTPGEWLQNNADLLKKFMLTRPTAVTLSLPRFDIAGGGDVSSFAKPLGLAALFTPQADFSALSEEPLQLGQIVHRATLKVDETGAEASAATAITGVRSLAVPQGVKLDFDRPFIAIVVDTRGANPEAVVAAVVNKVTP